MERAAKKDLQAVTIPVERWYEKALSRREWLSAYTEGALQYQQQLDTRKQRGPRTVQCGIWFCREADKARHKYTEERNKLVEDQQGSVQCPICLRVEGVWQNCHCPSETEEESSTQSSSVTCGTCMYNRSVSRQEDLKRHKCREDRMKPILPQKGAVQCKECD